MSFSHFETNFIPRMNPHFSIHFFTWDFKREGKWTGRFVLLYFSYVWKAKQGGNIFLRWERKWESMFFFDQNRKRIWESFIFTSGWRERNVLFSFVFQSVSLSVGRRTGRHEDGRTRRQKRGNRRETDRLFCFVFVLFLFCFVSFCFVFILFCEETEKQTNSQIDKWTNRQTDKHFHPRMRVWSEMNVCQTHSLFLSFFHSLFVRIDRSIFERGEPNCFTFTLTVGNILLPGVALFCFCSVFVLSLFCFVLFLF